MKIIDSTIVTKMRFLTLFAISYLDQKGKTKRWQMVSRNEQPKYITGDNQRPDAAIIVPYHRREKKLVVVREFRVPIGDYQYGFPAGLLDAGEDLVFSAGRELHEETGLDLIKVYRHSPAIFSSAGITDETIAMVFAEVEGTPSIHNNQDSEDIKICLMEQEEVRDLLHRSDIYFGARAWLAMDAYARMGEDYLTGN